MSVFFVASVMASQGPPLAHPIEQPGYLGVGLRDLDAAEATHSHAHGVMITTVDRDAPAWQAGLRPRDIVCDLNGQAVEDVETLRRRLRQYGPGQTITMRVHHGTEFQTVSLVLVDQDAVGQGILNNQPADDPDSSTASNSHDLGPRAKAQALLDDILPGSVYTGLSVEALTPQLAHYFGTPSGSLGLLVTNVEPDSPADASGLAAGDILLRAGSQATNSRSDLLHALRDARGKAVGLSIWRNHRQLGLQFEPGRKHKH